MRQWRAWVARALEWAWRRVAASARQADGPPPLHESPSDASIAGAALVIVSPEISRLAGRSTEEERWIADARRRLRTSAALGELARAATRGAVIACRIREEGRVTAEHLLAVSPRSEPWI